ncbi:hypothetical protein G7Y89_g14444 [Cudoniella acicularis]|uniref:Rhodopsin domain-containing protein n=1 Tax=Cudoniella acicularis TaxID=354080 RepID=A0A8H4R355_9HELO|nr:hypothetical protein G7Y89_g14444 [Cudoniella acicularis]
MEVLHSPDSQTERAQGTALLDSMLYFGNTRQTFSITAAGQKTYIMTSATNISDALRRPQDFDYSRVITDIMMRFGISKRAIRILHEKPSSSLFESKTLEPNPRLKSMADQGGVFLKAQLIPGKRFDEFQSIFLSGIDKRMKWDNLSQKAVFASRDNREKAGLKTVSLIELVRRTIVESTTVSFFGNAILEVGPTIVSDFLFFDDRIWLFLYGIPRPWASGMLQSKEKIHRAIQIYLELPKEKRLGASWLAFTLETEMKARGIATQDIAAWLFMLLWAFNTNTWRLCFWVCSYVFYDPSLLTVIRSEISPFTANYTSLSSLHADLSSCKRLNSVYHEVLRLVDSPVSLRCTTGPTTTALSEPIPTGSSVMLFHRQILTDEGAFGADAQNFNPERFLHKPNLVRNKSYSPFGGGAMLCPGQFMARGEVLIFLALAIERFELEVVKTRPFPKLETKTGAGFGILGPREGEDVVLKLAMKRVNRGNLHILSLMLCGAAGESQAAVLHGMQTNLQTKQLTMSFNPLDHSPAGIPPPGVIPNFTNPPSKGEALVVLDGVFVSLMLVAVLIRIYVRVRLVKTWGWDDYACILAACGSLVHMILYTQTVKMGFGRHIWDVPASWLLKKSNSQLLSVNGITYPFTIFCAKLSILLLYIRIFGVHQTMRIVAYTGIAVMGAFYTAMIGVAIGSLVKCNGLNALTVQFCRNYSGPVVMLNSVFNVVTDFFVLLLPFPFALKLQLTFARKIGLLAVFSGGLAACAASLARMIEFGIQYHTPDILWIQAINAEATIVEMNVGIIVACGTCIPAFYNHTKMALSQASVSLRSLFASSRSATTGTSHTGQGHSNVMEERVNSQTELKQFTPSIGSIRNAELA